MKTNYIMRLDDACPWRDIEKWDRMEELLDSYNVRPLVGLIPDCADESMTERYAEDKAFPQRVSAWLSKGWQMALHGCTHVYSTGLGGINPVNPRSEFAGEPLDVQKEKIRRGVEKMRGFGIEPRVFFAPSHTFDENTLTALRECSDIRIISDCIASTPYKRWGFTFVPQQSGRPRKLPFRLVTLCMHPNEMNDADFEALGVFLALNSESFIDFPLEEAKRDYSVIDGAESRFYFALRDVKVFIKDLKK